MASASAPQSPFPDWAPVSESVAVTGEASLADFDLADPDQVLHLLLSAKLLGL